MPQALLSPHHQTALQIEHGNDFDGFIRHGAFSMVRLDPSTVIPAKAGIQMLDEDAAPSLDPRFREDDSPDPESNSIGTGILRHADGHWMGCRRRAS